MSFKGKGNNFVKFQIQFNTFSLTFSFIFLNKNKIEPMKTIEIPFSEYQDLKNKSSLLNDKLFLEKVNKLIDILFQEKYGIYLGNYTDDLTEVSISSNWKEEKSKWDEV